MGRLREALKAAPPDVVAAIEEGRTVDVVVDGEAVPLAPGDVLVECTGKGGFVVAAERGCFVALDVTLDEDLVLEGLARETLNRLQNARKDLGLALTDRIRVVAGASGRLATALRRHATMLTVEALITALEVVATPPAGATAHDVEGEPLQLAIEKAP
jgi:isoleucyl-tRNA synthetase